MNALQMALVNVGVATEEQAVVETKETKLCYELGVLEEKLMVRIPPPDAGTYLLKEMYKREYIEMVREGRGEKERLDTPLITLQRSMWKIVVSGSKTPTITNYHPFMYL